MSCRSRLASLILFVIVIVGCNPALWLADQEPPSSGALLFREFTSTPIIIVGTILDNTQVGSPRRSRSNEYANVQLYRVMVHIENVLRGSVPDRDVPIYYFADTAALEGPARLGMAGNGGTWVVGDRELFFLRRDRSALRTSCDLGERCVIPVNSGEHPEFYFGRNKPIAYSIVDLLLTRGQNCTDQQMVEAVASGSPEFFSREYALQKIQQLATTETPAVRKQACKILALCRRPCPKQPSG